MRAFRWAPLIALFLIGLCIMACKSGYRSTSEVSVTGEDIVYLRDQRTDLCFAVLALENPLGTKIRQVAMVSVPCDSLQDVKTK